MEAVFAISCHLLNIAALQQVKVYSTGTVCLAMPPFVPRKRSPIDAELAEAEARLSKRPVQCVESDESDANSFGGADRDHRQTDKDGSDSDDDWEDALQPSVPPHEVADLEITLDNTSRAPETSKKGPSRIERDIRITTHRLHVLLLLVHNAVRNAWVNDPSIYAILRQQLPIDIQWEVRRWRTTIGLVNENDPENTLPKRKGKGKDPSNTCKSKKQLEPADMSDPTIQLLRLLATYWKKHFSITAPGLRKKGYRSPTVLRDQISAFQHDPTSHGERIENREVFRELARARAGSRDVGAQLFTALLRALGLEARLVASLQPIGFGWTKAESYSSEDIDPPLPVYWTEVVSPVTNKILPVEALVLPNAVASTPELLADFEPKGSKAEKAKQVIAYVIAFSPDKTAKDVTIRYLKRHTWPGKTKGFRIPAEKISVGPIEHTYDWFRRTMRPFMRVQRTTADILEDTQDLVPHRPERKSVKQGDTLQSLRASQDVVLERFLRREEAIRPGTKPIRIFTAGRGDKTREEPVFRRTDVVRCLSAETWHKEGRQICIGAAPLKLVPVRAVTLTRQREVTEAERASGERARQGLYSHAQTEPIIPPPIRDGIIPKNAYGNIDCFVPSMVPRGAVHVPLSGTARLCRRLQIDFAEAVTGFEFGSKMAVPVIEGVVVAAENATLVEDAWRADMATRQNKERAARQQRVLAVWRRLMMGVRIAERIQDEYGTASEESNPFVRCIPLGNSRQPDAQNPDIFESGGFFREGEDEDEGGKEGREGLVEAVSENERTEDRAQEPLAVHTDQPSLESEESLLSDGVSVSFSESNEFA